jgi:hypothetical protein
MKIMEKLVSMTESLTKVTHDMGFACDNLCEALDKAGNVEAIVVLDLISSANELRRDVEALLNAHELDITSYETAVEEATG